MKIKISLRFYIYNIFDPRMKIYLPKSFNFKFECLDNNEIQESVLDLIEYILNIYKVKNIIIYPELLDLNKDERLEIKFVATHLLYDDLGYSPIYPFSTFRRIELEYGDLFYNAIYPNPNDIKFVKFFYMIDGKPEKCTVEFDNEIEPINLRILANLINQALYLNIYL